MRKSGFPALFDILLQPNTSLMNILLNKSEVKATALNGIYWQISG